MTTGSVCTHMPTMYHAELLLQFNVRYHMRSKYLSPVSTFQQPFTDVVEDRPVNCQLHLPHTHKLCKLKSSQRVFQQTTVATRNCVRTSPRKKVQFLTDRSQRRKKFSERPRTTVAARALATAGESTL
ncbi:hypothetical protein AX14_014479 [Amanita brunnescens Koide BX004]|nr:hypothetical protein AX14_014479 [Amanita brunnescens Koide BX004]